MTNKQIARTNIAPNAKRTTNHKNLPKKIRRTRPKSFYTLYSSDASPSSSSLNNLFCSSFALRQCYSLLVRST
jgi:hypothetical protein